MLLWSCTRGREIYLYIYRSIQSDLFICLCVCLPQFVDICMAFCFSLSIYHNMCARGVMVIVAGNGHGDTSSNPGRDWLHFTVWSIYLLVCLSTPVCWYMHGFLFFAIYLSQYVCPWCNGYRRREWTRRYEFKSWTRLIAFHIVLIPLGKVWIQLFSLRLGVNSRAN